MNDLASQACLERYDGQKAILDSMSIGCCAEGNFDTRLKSCNLETRSRSDEALYLYETSDEPFGSHSKESSHTELAKDD